MVVVLTGVTSFTGTWFARELTARGHRVIGILSQGFDSYSGLRARRVAWLREFVDLVEYAPMGSRRLLDAMSSEESIDAVCWHHALVSSYLSPDFPLGEAISSAVSGAPDLARLLAERGCRVSVITHSVFESGQGSPPGGPPIGLYGVAKRAAGEALGIASSAQGMALRHFVICNPVGSWEEPRFTAYLVRQWSTGGVAELRAPSWVRDNIPVQLLAHAYADVVENVDAPDGFTTTPSWWVESNAEWAERIGQELGPRLMYSPSIAESSEPDKSQPQIRLGLDRIIPPASWDEQVFWDDYARFYGEVH